MPRLTLLCVLAAALSARADEKPTPDAARFAELKAKYDVDHAALGVTMAKALKGGQPEKAAWAAGRKAFAETYPPQLLKLGKSADEATALAALKLVIDDWRGSPVSDPAFDAFLKRFSDSPKLVDYLREDSKIMYGGAQDKRFAQVIETAKDPTALTLALHALARRTDPANTRIEDEDPSAQNARADKALALYRRIIAEFPNVEKGVWAKSAAWSVLALTQLRAGLPAPSIDAKDSDGKPLKLSDLKGKVVVVDFWGSWCGPCIKKLPMLKEVAAKYAGQDVVFVGVMNEGKATDATAALETHKLPWRNVIDAGEAGAESPICKAWGVSSFPSLFVIDAKGKFAATNIMERAELEAAIEAALAAK